MSEARRLTGAVVIVTGASSGIGEATARLLHRDGARPVLVARRRDRVEALGGELGGALAVEADVTVDADRRRLVEETLARHGRIDGLINNAGGSLHEPLEQVDLSEFRHAFELNTVSVLALMQAMVAPMRAEGGGAIVNISSGTTRRATPGTGPYAATKAAVNLLSAVAREELAADGIAVTCLFPSITATDFRGGLFRTSPPPGMIAQSPEYVAGFVLRALRYGEAEIVIPPGPEQPGLIDRPTEA
jgi:short-subunit dehydrogenase